MYFKKIKLTDEKDENSKELREELENLKSQNRLLEEQLQLQKTNWLYSHHLLLSICFGIVYGAIIGNLPYVFMDALRFSPQPLHDLVAYVVDGLAIFSLFGLPFLAYLLFIVLLKAPSFAYKGWFAYLLSFFLSQSLIFYVDPFNLLSHQYYGVERLTQEVLPVTLTLLLITVIFTIFIPQFAEKCGYRLVLDGSTYSFEVDANISTVSKQLEKLEEDFKFALVRIREKPKTFYFEKSEKGKKVLQFLLQPKENKTDVVVVMHSIINDIPTRIGRNEVTKFGEIFTKWLEVSGDFTILETENKLLVNEMIQKSKESFYRQPVTLPSRKVVMEFLKVHWKDILIIISILVALLSWIFPIR